MTYALIVRGLSDSYFLQLEKKDTRPSMQFLLSFLLYLLVNIFLSFSVTGDYLTTEKTPIMQASLDRMIKNYFASNGVCLGLCSRMKISDFKTKCSSQALAQQLAF